MFFENLKNLTKWILGIFFIFTGGILLLPPINNLIKSKYGHLKFVEKTNDWGRFIIVFVISTFILNLFSPSSTIQQAKPKSATPTVYAGTPSNKSEQINKNIDKLAKALDIDKGKSNEIYKILAECGAKDITYIEKMQDTDLPSYFIAVSNANNPVRLGLTAQNTVDMVIYDSWILYEKGKLQDNLQNYTISEDDLKTLKLLTMQNLRSYITYPNTAKFGSDWQATALDGSYNLSSKVKYKNALNQKQESKFNVQFTKTSNGFKMTTLSIDGQSVLKEQSQTKKLTAKDKKEVKEIEKLMGM